jgi:anthranilate phosphoribosyltransferase
MLSRAALETILNPESNDETVLGAFDHLQINSVDLGSLNASIELLRQQADLKADLAIELRELGRVAIDCSGTGGSGISHFNVSTSVAFVLAAGGFKVAKFGGRAASGKSGSFDFLDCLGIGSNLALHNCADAISVCGIAFIFAPQVYPQLRRLVPLRKQFGKPTLLNYVGPLLNPLRPAARLMGISSDAARQLIAQYLQQDGTTERAMLVTAGAKLDEFSIHERNLVSLVDSAKGLTEFELDPANLTELHLASASVKATHESDEEILDPQASFRIFSKIIEGDDISSAHFKMLLLNSAAALFVLKACKTVSEGISIAADLIADGSVRQSVATAQRFYERLSR